jgi:hypothetical protein
LSRAATPEDYFAVGPVRQDLTIGLGVEKPGVRSARLLLGGIIKSIVLEFVPVRAEGKVVFRSGWTEKFPAVAKTGYYFKALGIIL